MSALAPQGGTGAAEAELGRPEKRSLTLRGHRTSVSLERAFWEAFRALARAEGKTLNALAAEIDERRGASAGLASAIRVHVLRWHMARAKRSGDTAPESGVVNES